MFVQRCESNEKELSRIYSKQDDELECVVRRGRRRDSVADNRDETLGSMQRGDLCQRREQVHAHAELQVRLGHLHLLQGLLLVPELPI